MVDFTFSYPSIRFAGLETVNEDSTAYLGVSAAGMGAVSLLKYRIDDLGSGEEIRGDTEVPDPGAAPTITLTPADNVILRNRNDKEMRIVTVTLVGLTEQVHQEYRYLVKNLRMIVSTPVEGGYGFNFSQSQNSGYLATLMADILKTLKDGNGAPFVVIFDDNDDPTGAAGLTPKHVLPAGAATQATLAELLTELQSKAGLAQTQPVSAVALPLPAGAATDAGLTTLIAGIQVLLTELEAKANLADTQPVDVINLPVVQVDALPGVEGTTAHGSADDGTPPLKVGAVYTADPALVADGQVVKLRGGPDGSLSTVPSNYADDSMAVVPAGLAAAAGNVHAPAADTAAIVTKAAGGAGVKHIISGVAWSYDAEPTGGNLKVEDGAATVFSVDITAAGPGFFPFPDGLKGADDADLVVTLAAAGAAVTGKVSVLGHRTVNEA